MSDINKVTIIGSGPAGYTAAIYTARSNLKPVMFAGGPTEHDATRVPGGQLMITNDVENYPGFPESVTGPDLMEKFQKQAERFGTKVHLENAVKVDFSKRPFTIVGESVTYQSEAVIIATGATAKYLGLPSEGKFKNRGVSACATCDGFLYRGKEVIVVGGGDTAMEEATHLGKMCTKVTVIHRRDTLRASKIMQERALKHPKLNFVWNSAIEEIVGDDKGVTGAIVKNVKSGDTHKIDAAAVFVAIGHVPNTELFKGVLDLHPNGYLKVAPGTTRTNIEGVFACGDVADSYYRQAVTAAGTGCMAAIEVERWMIENNIG
ncbi:MAG: thioredoxin-disulfide reductase [Myxococcaceae bacterium]|nr:thioredoxin-disulfide reductase [Myxococcaceae bacterium]